MAKKKESRILVVGDLHEPVCHPGYRAFCKDLYEEWECNQVLFIGDIVDWHGISFWDKEPNCPGPKDEYKLALKQVKKWYKLFPEAKVCIGNHDERPERVAKKGGLPKEMLRTYADVWETPGWTWNYNYVIDGVYYEHGTGRGGMYPAANLMKAMQMSSVMGHVHAAAGVKYTACPHQATFSLDTGCGIEIGAWQFVYGKNHKGRPLLAAGIVLGGKHAYSELMPIGKGERYDNAKYKAIGDPNRLYWD